MKKVDRSGATVPLQSKFQKHLAVLIWKSYLQRRRRWRWLVGEGAIAVALLAVAVVLADPVFLRPLRAEPEPPLATPDLFRSLPQNTVVGYAPDLSPYSEIMERVATVLEVSFMSGRNENDLNNNLYMTAKDKGRTNLAVLWVIWKPNKDNTWRFRLRSTERARYQAGGELAATSNPHLRAGFLAVQLAVSQAVIAHSTPHANYEVRLVSMPVSPLMQQEMVRRALSGILLCFTAALIPPVVETQALVVAETTKGFKTSLRTRGVSYACMYLGWLVFAFLTALPACFMAAITLLLIFRWIHLFLAIMLLLSYVFAMILIAFIMAMFSNKRWIACVWTTLLTLLQAYTAELLVHHEYDQVHGAVTFLLHLLMPPLGLVHAMNHFALLSTGSALEIGTSSLWYSFGSWGLLIVLYFIFLMILQKTIGKHRAIGGQVSWKSVMFKKVQDVNELHEIENPKSTERDKLQEVDDLVAKAVSFRNVSKSVMGVPVVENLTFDIYRGEYTMLFAERLQCNLVMTVADLLIGLAHPDHGTINVLGRMLHPGESIITEEQMMGCCHHDSVLIQDLTVAEHFKLYGDICMWQETRVYKYQYSQMRWKQLAEECSLEGVQHQQVQRLHMYYRAQLSWALAMLMEPRIVLVPNFSDQDPVYNMVMRDKIMQYKKYITVIQLCFSSLEWENADRVFIFDNKVLAFGGTPAYMFFKYGREYRVRMTMKSDGTSADESMRELIARAAEAGGSVRAYLGSLLILRLPTEPTEAVAKLVKDWVENADQYGVVSMHISVPDSEEVYRRVMSESRTETYEPTKESNLEAAKKALEKMAEPPDWKTPSTVLNHYALLKMIAWKHFSFHAHHRLYFVVTVFSAVLAGIFIGLSFSRLLARSERDEASHKVLRRDVLTLEFLDKPTTLVVRSDDNANSISLANAYVLSEAHAPEDRVNKISYTGLVAKESLTEYLVTRAIDSPQMYVTMFAYGLDVKTDPTEGTLKVQVLYSPLHRDQGAAARSLAKAYTALLRHYTGNLDASILVTDDPLVLDHTPWMILATKPPLFVQFLLIVAISYMTLIPSMEHGFIKHMQVYARNFSITRYWALLSLCDLVLYWLLVAGITGCLVLIMWLAAPIGHFEYSELMVVPFLLVVYGVACVPQAYLFSMGPGVALNCASFIVVNVVFGETTIIAQTFYGDVLKYALLLMRLSPQFNMAYALIKTKQIFLYNSECFIFERQKLCTEKILHKCCKKCGVLQECFKKKSYLSMEYGISKEILSMISLAVLYAVILLVLEYKVPARVSLWWTRSQLAPQLTDHFQPGARREKENAEEKFAQIQHKQSKERFNTFGECLLAHNLIRKHLGVYLAHSIYLGVAKGEALALSGLERHGRLDIVELLGGYKFPDAGHSICMSKWDLGQYPHRYCREVSVSVGGRTPLPPWLTLYDGLALLALLRGVPASHIRRELKNVLDALEIQDHADWLIRRLPPIARTRLHFAAAVVGHPPVVIVDEFTKHQTHSVCRAMYSMLHYLRRRGHAIITSASRVEGHLPMTNRLAIILDGSIFDVGQLDELVARYSRPGYTAVLHLKDEADVRAMFSRYFRDVVINDTSEVLVNVQIRDPNLSWATVFERMEDLKETYDQVYSYIITVIPIDYIYNSIINNEKGKKVTSDLVSGFRFERYKTRMIKPSQEKLDLLIPFEQKYDVVKLKELPWSVIFQT